jgi:hypothetical protein
MVSLKTFKWPLVTIKYLYEIFFFWQTLRPPQILLLRLSGGLIGKSGGSCPPWTPSILHTKTITLVEQHNPWFMIGECVYVDVWASLEINIRTQLTSGLSPGFSRRSEGPGQGQRAGQRTGDAEEQEAQGQGLGGTGAGPRRRPGDGGRATGKTRPQRPKDCCVNVLVVNDQ